MATLPRSPPSSKFLSSSSAAAQRRPLSDFDAGINASTAWTEHLVESAGSLSDEEPDEDVEGTNRPARALYDFEGKSEFRELSVDAGDELEVVKEDLADGWSLVKNIAGEVDFTETPEVTAGLAAGSRFHQREASSSTITPRGSVVSQEIVPQNTGEWRTAFPNFRQSLLGGKSLNRFSTFVTSGAEEWVLKGTTAALPDGAVSAHRHEKTGTDDDEEDSEEAEEERNRLNRLGLDEDPARTSTLSGAFTIYAVTSLFHPPAPDGDAPLLSPTRITVHRRFSHFVILHTALTRRLPGIALPPLPEKQYAGRFSEDFVEARRGDLERYIARIVRHPVARYAEVVTFFLGCESDTEWKRLVPQHLAMPAAGPSFYARVFHPDFNVDADDATESVDRFDRHTRAIGKGVQGLRNIFGRVREARIEMSKAERLLSYSLLSLITSKPLASAPVTGASEEEEDYNAKGKGLLNEDGAWCWREGCQECLKLTKAMQKTSEALQSVAGFVRRPCTADTVGDSRGTEERCASIVSATATDKQTDSEMAARCETVLNTTMAEMETYHTQKNEDFSALTKEHLDGEIAFYEQVLNRLRGARRGFDEPQFTQLGAEARQASMYERELEHPRLTAAPLSQPRAARV
ncbi:Sorting nexin lst-4 [Mycena sanguinolenta]|uniref:Sorting nexin lst-4 n=1 Tax=Mycena sanguinolenta TaxID=230812 RepID=A0A8H7CQH3_9AGAR|nr:Sorting nexin lst-4 [Mycena sanguinolenta]